MLQPKRTKYRKMQKGRVTGLAHRGSTISFGSFAIKSLEASWITSRQIEAARIAMTRAMKREGQVWIFRGEVYGKKDLTPNAGLESKGPGSSQGGDRRNAGGNRKKTDGGAPKRRDNKRRQ